MERIGDYPLMISVRQMSEITGIAEKTLRQQCADGLIEAVKIGGQWRINRKKVLGE